MLEIEVVIDAQRTRHLLGAGRHKVGRSERCEVQLPGVTEVSKVHLELSVDATPLMFTTLARRTAPSSTARCSSVMRP